MNNETKAIQDERNDKEREEKSDKGGMVRTLTACLLRFSLCLSVCLSVLPLYVFFSLSVLCPSLELWLSVCRSSCWFISLSICQVVCLLVGRFVPLPSFFFLYFSYINSHTKWNESEHRNSQHQHNITMHAAWGPTGTFFSWPPLSRLTNGPQNGREEERNKRG